MATFVGTGGPDNLQGGGENDFLVGLGGNDTLNGGAGADNMVGGAGDDTYFVDNVGDVVEERDQNGDDTLGDDLVVTSINYTLGANVERLSGATGTANVSLTGNLLANTITGNAGNNVLDGGLDAAGVDGTLGDTLTGGAGNDTYIVRDGAVTIIEAADNDVSGNVSGSDTVFVVASQNRTTFTVTATNSIEAIIASDASSTLDLNLTGNEFAQTIAGNAGNNVLTAGANPSGTANDTLIGFGGDDTYVIANSRVTITEAAGAGNDTVLINATGSGTYTFAQSIETIDASGSASSVTSGTTTTLTTLNITGGTTSQSITGSASGNNRLVGGGGTDTLNGGTGNDTFTVDSFDDEVNDAGTTTGFDRVIAGSSYALAADSGIEYFTAAGTTLSTFVGQGDGTRNLNALNTTVTSNFFVGDNATEQFIFGDAGGNILNGRISADLADGEDLGEIADTLIGGAGNDTYRVYSQNDVVIEDSAGGTADFIYTSTSFNLATNDANARLTSFSDDTVGTDANSTPARAVRAITDYIGTTGPTQIEILSAADQAAGETGTRSVDLTGNAYGQIIVGDFGDNIISDGGSRVANADGTFIQYQDQLAGLGGNDFYFVTAQNTTVNEGIGNGDDVVNVNLDAITAADGAGFFSLIADAEVEFVNAAGSEAIGLRGNRFNQVLTGNAAANTLDGNGGQDTLVGGDGDDNYVITAANAANVTIIETSGEDAGNDTVVTTVSFDLKATNAEYRSAPTLGAADENGQQTFIEGEIVEGDDTPISIENIIVADGTTTNNVNLTGNGLAQFIVGNFGNNILDGDNDSVDGDDNLIGSGTVQSNAVVAAPNGTNSADTVLTVGDTLTGLFGNDTYRVYNQADVVRESTNQGTDVVFTSGNYQLRQGTSIEVLSAADQADTTGLRLIGNELAQRVIGTAGNDQLWGGLGNDTLVGGAGSDTYGFSQAGAANADLLQDFARGDFIGLYTGGRQTGAGDFSSTTFGAYTTANGTELTGLTAVRSADAATGVTAGTAGFDQNEFVVGTAATEAHAQVIYNQTTGQLFYDADGTGTAATATLFATVAAGTALGFNDFVLLNTAPSNITEATTLPAGDDLRAMSNFVGA